MPSLRVVRARRGKLDWCWGEGMEGTAASRLAAAQSPRTTPRAHASIAARMSSESPPSTAVISRADCLTTDKLLEGKYGPFDTPCS